MAAAAQPFNKLLKRRRGTFRNDTYFLTGTKHLKTGTLKRTLTSLRKHWQRALLIASALLLAGTFLRPGITLRQPLFDYVIVLDVTQSMNVQDYSLDGKPISRLQYMKHALRRVLSELPCGSKVGWGIFTEYRSFLLFAPVEVCANYPELVSTLGHMDGRMAWTGNSEIAKGLYSGLSIAKSLQAKPALVFMTDGQEAPPLNPLHRPPTEHKKGDVPGLIVGVGGYTPAPIPKVDPTGRPLGFWRADEVMQTDARSAGRGGSVANEKLVETEAAGPVDPALKGFSGLEHLSFVRATYLKLLGSEMGLGYHHLQSIDGLIAALTDEKLARDTAARADLRYLLAALALLALLVVFLAWPIRHAASAIRTRIAALAAALRKPRRSIETNPP